MSSCSENWHVTSAGSGEMFSNDFADMFTGKFDGGPSDRVKLMQT